MRQVVEKARVVMLIHDETGNVTGGQLAHAIPQMASRPANLVIWLKEPTAEERQMTAARRAIFAESAEINTYPNQQLEADLATIQATLRRTEKEKAELETEVRLNSDFMALMAAELAEFPCCHEDGSHKGTPPMMWPELVGCIAKKARLGAEADAKASEMMLKQVCEERDALKKEAKDFGYDSLADEREANAQAIGRMEASFDQNMSAYKAEITRLRELLRDCPLLHEINGKRIGVVFPGMLEEGAVKFQQDGINWIERAKEEALKL